MSAGNVEVVRACIEAWCRGDFPTSLSLFAEDAVWHGYGIEAGPYRGRDGVERAMEVWVGAFTGYWLENIELIDAGDDVVHVWREGGIGKASGVRVENEGATVFGVRDGLIVRVEFHADREAALAAATSDAGPGPRP